MDTTHIHLILTHFPIVGTIIGVLILAYGYYSKEDSIKKAALFTFVLMALLTIPVYLSGEEAEETVEHIAGVSERIIDQHEDLAEVAIWFMAVLGISSLLSFYAISKELAFAKKLTLVTLIISIVTFGVFAQVGNLGGQIHHSEIRPNSTQIKGDANENEMSKFQGTENDDDNDDDDDDDDDD